MHLTKTGAASKSAFCMLFNSSDRFDDTIGKNIYCIPKSSEQFILYAPLHGMVLLVNDAYIDCFKGALCGDSASITSLGIDNKIIEGLTSCPPQIQNRVQPKWPPNFRPTNLTLFLTHKCTLRCTYCYCEGGKGNTMPWRTAESAILYTIANAVKSKKKTLGLHFHGGDIGASWDLFQKAVNFARRQCQQNGIQCKIDLGTNAVYSKSQAVFIAKNIDGATVSLDGMPSVHNAYRILPDGTPSLPHVLKTLSTFDRYGLNYAIRMTVTADTVDKLPLNIKYICTNTPAKKIRAEPMYTRGRASTKKIDAPPAQEFIDKFREAKQIADQYNRQLAYSGARIGHQFCTFCSYVEPTFGVTPEGHLTACYEVLNASDELADQFFYGHMSQECEVEANHQKITKMRNNAYLNRANCEGCFCYWDCAGDCAAKAQHQAMGHDKIPERCFITRELTKDILLTMV